MSNDVIQIVKFSDLNVSNPFFDSLKDAYDGFTAWFEKKSLGEETVYILQDQEKLLGFLYLKEEDEEDTTIDPPLHKKRRLKIGTFKIMAHGTVLGERFLGIILKKMIEESFEETYVTLFDEQKGLIKLFEKFGFLFWGKKENGELVYNKILKEQNDIFKDFPRITTHDTSKYLLSILPEYHTKLFPYSKLNTEKEHKIEDLSFTNTVQKVYLTKMSGTGNLKPKDNIVIYRMKDVGKKAEYSSVATSICTVVETRRIESFRTLQDFLDYCGKGVVFSDKELRSFWATKRYPIIIKMLYNFSLNKRIIRQRLIEEVGLERNAYAGFMQLTDSQFNKIMELGETDESFIID
ncbi:GNAT family N-acetyltransferase [Paenibacillus massiliensis]|uniref:GNAT family N-acetyltransferase n=1 Tax=Paenibacillus massiliensis TaxID=225917 RepID=UPI00048E03F4|nr:GNAT family N-acetyltransferase [Paenibacillus massiliensis]